MNIKKMRWMALCGILFLASCGGGGGGGSAEAAADASIDAFLSIMFSENLQPCVDCTVGPVTCQCPGGGTVTVSDDCGSVTVTNCKSSDGKNFNGTATTDGDLLDVNMTSFGECNNVTGNDIPLDACMGSITGVCAGENLTCTIVDDPDEPDECDLDC